MPSTQTNLKALDRKIRELEERDALSDANARHLRFLQLWREHGLKDVVLCIEPKGAIRYAGMPTAAMRFVEVTDMVAADLLAYADLRNQKVRLATDEEVAEFNAGLERQRQEHMGRIAAHQAQVTQAAARALIGGGYDLPPGVAPGPAPAPVAPLPGLPMVGQAPTAPIPPAPPGSAPVLGEGQPGQTTLQPPEGANQPAPGAGPLLASITSAKTVEALVAAGFTTVQAVADADPSDLASKVDGVGQARAAELIAKASEAIAQAEPPAPPAE